VKFINRWKPVLKNHVADSFMIEARAANESILGIKAKNSFGGNERGLIFKYTIRKQLIRCKKRTIPLVSRKNGSVTKKFF